MKKKSSVDLGIVGAIVIIGIFLTAIYGWVLNIIALASVTTASTGMYILGGLGVFMPPLGAIMGLFVW